MKARNLSLSLTFFGILLCLLAAAVALTDAGQAPAAQAAAPASVLASDVMTQPAAAPVLQIALRPSADRPAWGEVFTYTLVMRNAGDAVAPGAVMTNALPDGLTYVSGTLQATSGAAEYQAAERTIRWQGDLALNAAVTLTYAAQLLTQDYLYNTAVLTHPLAAASAGATSSPADAWGAPEVIAEGRVFDYKLASYRNIAVDSQGRPRIAYGGETGLYYATFANGAWTSVQVPVTPTRPTKAALVLDPQDRALIAFYDDIWGYIWLAREISPTANTWSLEQVSSKYFDSNFMERVDIQLDNAGRLHLVYYDGDAPSGHYYTVYEGGAWHAPALAVASSTCAFALDANDIPHLACKESAYLRLYTYTGASPWSSFEQVAAGLDDKAIYAPSLAYAGTTPHVAFLRRNNGLYHATKSDSWTTTQVDTSPWTSGVLENTPLVSAAAIRGGQIAIAYAWRWYPAGSSAHTETIRLATRPLTSTAWITESVDSVSDASWSQDWARPALALDSVGRAHLAYYYLLNQTLRHAAQTGSFTHYTVDENSTLGGNAGIDVGSDGSVHVAYFAAGLRHAYSLANTTTWTKTLVAAGLDGDATPIDLAVDAANTPHLVYQSNSLLLHHAILSGAAWSTRTIDAPGVRTNPALDADAGGTAHAAYLALEGANLVVRHAAFAGATWTPKTLAIAGPPGHTQSPQLVAQGGKVYVLYADCIAYQASGDYPITLTLQTLADGAWRRQSLHSFTGQCGGRLDYQLLGDSAGRLAAVVTIQDAADQITSLTLWLEGSAAETAQRTLDVERTTWRSDGVRAPLGGVTIVKPISQVRGDGLETLSSSSGNKYARYQDRQGNTTPPYKVGNTLDTWTAVKQVACYGQTGAALEYSRNQQALAVERTTPPVPTNWANATKSATPAAVYAYERITYTIRLEWQGDQPAPIVLQDETGPIETVTMTVVPKVVYIPGSLTWGAYINQCHYDEGTTTIHCNGIFPASANRLETTVTFAVEPRCPAYEDGEVENVAQVGIGSYYFAPAVKVSLKTPYRLRASTPRFLPKSHFAPVHEALLYTVPKGDEPDDLLRYCAFDAYTRLTLGVGSGTLQAMRNDGQNPDFYANDHHHSVWVNLANGEPYRYDLYVVRKGGASQEARKADILTIDDVYPPARLNLAVFTDFQAMFNEWREIGLLYDDERRDAHIQDRNQNRILDYYDAVERIRQYAADNDGIVIDVAQDAYSPQTRQAGYYNSFATRDTMGKAIDVMAFKLPFETFNIAIIGTDAVLPYRRIPVEGVFTADETKFSADQWLAKRKIPAILDIGDPACGAKGCWLSDIPYANSTGPRLARPIGRVFLDRPLDLVKLIDDLERPINLRRATSSAWVVSDENDANVNFDQATLAFYAPPLSRFYGAANFISVKEAPRYTDPFGRGAAFWVSSNTRLSVPDDPEEELVLNREDVRKIAANTGLLIFNTHGNQEGFEPEVKRPILIGGTYRLLIGSSCHVGLLPGARGHTRSDWDQWWVGRGALETGAAMFAATSYFINPPLNMDRFHQQLASTVLRKALDWDYRTVGEVYVSANAWYRCGLVKCDAQDTQSLYTYHLIGLPTQPIEIRAAAPAVSVSPATQLAAGQPASAAAAHNLDRSVVIPHFEPVADADGRVVFTIPHNGALGGEAFGPIWPEVWHHYLLPLQADGVSVTAGATQSHLHPGQVDISPLIPVDLSWGPISGTITPTNPYPATVLDYRVYTDANRLRLDVRLIPFQHDPTARTARLYDRIDYRVAYNAAATYTVAAIAVNGGAAVAVDQTALPIAVTLNAAEPFSGTLYWEIMDAAGAPLYRGETPLDIAAGEHQVALNAAVGGWVPGPKQIVVGLAAGATSIEGETVAAGHTLFTVEGHSLALETDRITYGGAVAILTAAVRDHTGAAMAGQAGSLAARLDGAGQALAWQGNGVYTAALNLAGVAAGQHFISVTLGSQVVERGLLVDRQPPTSTLTGPSVVAAPTFTVTLSGDDDLSGVGEYVVQYRIGAGGAWTDWLTRTVGWDYTGGGAADPTLTFGPTEPAALQPGQMVHFRTRAVDVAGNREAEHPAADLSVTYGALRRTIYLPLVMRQ